MENVFWGPVKEIITNEQCIKYNDNTQIIKLMALDVVESEDRLRDSAGLEAADCRLVLLIYIQVL